MRSGTTGEMRLENTRAIREEMKPKVDSSIHVGHVRRAGIDFPRGDYLSMVREKTAVLIDNFKFDISLIFLWNFSTVFDTK